MPKQKSMNTPMARAFFRHYEHKHQFMKQYLDPTRTPPSASGPTPLYNYDWSAGAMGSESVTRSGTATYINSSGVRLPAPENTLRLNYSGETPNTLLGVMVEPAATNLAVQSQSIGTVWYGGGVTVSENSGGTGLDGTNSLDVVTSTATTAIRATWIDIPLGSYLSLTWNVKMGTSRWVYFAVYDAAFSDPKIVWVDLQEGIVGTVTSGGTVLSEVRAFARKLANGIVETRISLKTTGTASVEVQIYHSSGDNVTTGTVGTTYLFDSFQAETGSSPTSYVPTTDAAASRGYETVSIPMADGSYDILVEDTFGGEWRNAVTVGSGSYSVIPRTGQFHVTRIKAYGAGVLSANEKAALAPDRPYGYLAGYSLTWNEEFEDADVSRFSENGNVTGSGGGKAWLARLPDSSRKINNESQQYANSSYLGIQPFLVGNSVLRIKADVIPEGTPGVPTNAAYEPDSPFKFYSGIITTHGIQTWTYGIFEIRCKVSAVNGVWPAFWLLNPLDAASGKYGELDVMELVGDHANRSYHFAHEYSGVNIPSASKGRASYFAPGSTIADWHVYAAKWEPGRLRWYVDGALVQDMATTWLDDTPLYMLLNMAVSTAVWTGADVASGAGDPNPAQLPAYLDIDYVRVFQASS